MEKYGRGLRPSFFELWFKNNNQKYFYKTGFFSELWEKIFTSELNFFFNNSGSVLLPYIGCLLVFSVCAVKQLEPLYLLIYLLVLGEVWIYLHFWQTIFCCSKWLSRFQFSRHLIGCQLGFDRDAVTPSIGCVLFLFSWDLGSQFGLQGFLRTLFLLYTHEPITWQNTEHCSEVPLGHLIAQPQQHCSYNECFSRTPAAFFHL